MERTLDVPTGESIALHYELAGLGSRFLAVMIDLAIQLGVVLGVVVVLYVAAVLFVLAGGRDALVGLAGAGKFVSAVTIAALVLFVFALFFGYFIAFELAWNGSTPGKRALGIRVVRDGGFPVDAGAAVIRNVVRTLEVSLGFYLLTALVVLCSRENKRIGDYAAGTIVVRDAAAGSDVLAVLVDAGRERDDGLTPDDRELVAQFLARRDDLEPAARERVAAQIGARVRPRLRASFAHLDDESLLEHLGR